MAKKIMYNDEMSIYSESQTHASKLSNELNSIMYENDKNLAKAKFEKVEKDMIDFFRTYYGSRFTGYIMILYDMIAKNFGFEKHVDLENFEKINSPEK